MRVAEGSNCPSADFGQKRGDPTSARLLELCSDRVAIFLFKTWQFLFDFFSIRPHTVCLPSQTSCVGHAGSARFLLVGQLSRMPLAIGFMDDAVNAQGHDEVHWATTWHSSTRLRLRTL
jgi:hypothetical protein